jgi:hypothetical protein
MNNTWGLPIEEAVFAIVKRRNNGTLGRCSFCNVGIYWDKIRETVCTNH